MTGLTASPRILKGGLIVMAPGGGAVRNTIALQYNPDTLTRSYEVQGVGGDGGGERAQPFRLKGPAVRIFVFEFITGGGLYCADHWVAPESLLREGAAMAAALISDLATICALRVSTLVDERLAATYLPRECDVSRMDAVAALEPAFCEHARGACECDQPQRG